jgi:hypothetical protein
MNMDEDDNREIARETFIDFYTREAASQQQQ